MSRLSLKLGIVATLFVVAIGGSVAFADELTHGYSSEYLVDKWLTVQHEGKQTLVTINMLYEFPSALQVPEEIYLEFETTGGGQEIVSIGLQDLWEEEFGVEPEPEGPVAPPTISPEQQAGLDEKIAELEKIYEDAVTCRAYGTEGNSMFQQYLEERISKEKESFTELPVNTQEAKLIKAHEACRVFFEVAVHISNDPAMLNKFKAQQLAEIEEAQRLKEKLETTTVLTDPVTEEDIIEEIEDAEQIFADYPGFYKNPYGECEATEEFPERCDNRGGFTTDESGTVIGAECGTTPNETGPPTAVCPIRDYNAMISQAVSEEGNYANIEKLVCANYLSQYQHLVERIESGDETAELPHWLSHCEVE